MLRARGWFGRGGAGGGVAAAAMAGSILLSAAVRADEPVRFVQYSDRDSTGTETFRSSVLDDQLVYRGKIEATTSERTINATLTTVYTADGRSWLSCTMNGEFGSSDESRRGQIRVERAPGEKAKFSASFEGQNIELDVDLPEDARLLVSSAQHWSRLVEDLDRGGWFEAPRDTQLVVYALSGQSTGTLEVRGEHQDGSVQVSGETVPLMTIETALNKDTILVTLTVDDHRLIQIHKKDSPRRLVLAGWESLDDGTAKKEAEKPRRRRRK